MPQNGTHSTQVQAQANGAVLWVVGVSTLLSAMGVSGVTLALPAIGKEFGLSIAATRWVVLAFLLSASSLMLVAGRLGDLLGLRRVFLAGFWTVAVATLACGLAPSFAALAAARALHGVGGAMVMATGPALLTTTSPPERRGRVLGTVATATYAGLTAGPMLGGLLVDLLGWRWVFLVNVPFSAAILFAAHRKLPPAGKPKGGSLDLPGALLLVAGLPLLMLPPALGGKDMPGWVPAAGLAGLALLVLFVLQELRTASPLFELRLLRNREFAGSVLAAMFNYVALFVLILLMPFYLVEGRLLAPKSAGLVMAVMPFVMALVAFPAGRASDRVGTRKLCVTGMLLLAASLAALSLLGAASPLPYAALGLLASGLGTGIFVSPNSSSLMGSAPRHQQGIASGALAVSRNLGMLLGTAAGAGVFLFAGGHSGHDWAAPDFSAFSVALLVGAGAAAVSALFSALRPARSRP